METLTPEGRQARAAYKKRYDSNLTEEQREKRREYARKWRKANPDKIKAIRIRYWNRQGEKLAQASTITN